MRANVEVKVVDASDSHVPSTLRFFNSQDNTGILNAVSKYLAPKDVNFAATNRRFRAVLSAQDYHWKTIGLDPTDADHQNKIREICEEFDEKQMIQAIIIILRRLARYRHANGNMLALPILQPANTDDEKSVFLVQLYLLHSRPQQINAAGMPNPPAVNTLSFKELFLLLDKGFCFEGLRLICVQDPAIAELTMRVPYLKRQLPLNEQAASKSYKNILAAIGGFFEGIALCIPVMVESFFFACFLAAVGNPKFYTEVFYERVTNFCIQPHTPWYIRVPMKLITGIASLGLSVASIVPVFAVVFVVSNIYFWGRRIWNNYQAGEMLASPTDNTRPWKLLDKKSTVYDIAKTVNNNQKITLFASSKTIANNKGETRSNNSADPLRLPLLQNSYLHSNYVTQNTSGSVHQGGGLAQPPPDEIVISIPTSSR